MQVAKKITDRLHEPNINCWGDHQRENRLITFYNPTKSDTNKTIQITLFDMDREHSHRNGRIIGKVDLSKIVDYRARGHRRA